MDERAALSLVGDRVAAAGDDCAVVDDLVVTTDMLHETTDFPDGTSRYTAGWRSVGASLSDVAAMGAEATAAVAVYGAPQFDADEIAAFIEGCLDVCEAVDAEYVGGDLDGHEEFTVATTAFGQTDAPVYRSGASPGDAVCVTGTLGRSAAALRRFEAGDTERGNELFRFEPRVAAGRGVAPHATAMMDSSDGLARSLHQLAAASGCGFAIEADAIPVAPAVEEVADGPSDRRELAVHFGEDFELVATMPETAVDAAAEASPVALTRVGTVTESGVTMDGEALPDRGYTH
ncbi:thiamine-monophosphate kinase [Natronomonas pharaonis DSM 2160]|uniref:Thiamine-monophosphate kinase n=1 Tax=Natronomonas pharaonis (strain ATCC 35678 / DSM 2160 / CIP 103997 / JCM 8858 / NBRC 14720 / NCIMB 2260 / Gabara) TaxID=348780 RepID=A0A1U7EVY8_NATPD|nr:thiamine-phosphate kinase [Natronomonas pharaonis]CAI49231.1 thiamine-monophosphate kinase [Natronomonas pharaonis DSM 2160]